jgi:hypothetical protein
MRPFAAAVALIAAFSLTGCFERAQGPQGPAGPPGAAGPAGPQGPAGSLTGLEVLAVNREKVRTEFCKIYLAGNAKAKVPRNLVT